MTLTTKQRRLIRTNLTRLEALLREPKKDRKTDRAAKAQARQQAQEARDAEKAKKAERKAAKAERNAQHQRNTELADWMRDKGLRPAGAAWVLAKGGERDLATLRTANQDVNPPQVAKPSGKKAAITVKATPAKGKAKAPRPGVVVVKAPKVTPPVPEADKVKAHKAKAEAKKPGPTPGAKGNVVRPGVVDFDKGEVNAALRCGAPRKRGGTCENTVGCVIASHVAHKAASVSTV